MKGAAPLCNLSVWEPRFGGFTWGWGLAGTIRDQSRGRGSISYHPIPLARPKFSTRTSYPNLANSPRKWVFVLLWGRKPPSTLKKISIGFNPVVLKYTEFGISRHFWFFSCFHSLRSKSASTTQPRTAMFLARSRRAEPGNRKSLTSSRLGWKTTMLWPPSQPCFSTWVPTLGRTPSTHWRQDTGSTP